MQFITCYYNVVDKLQKLKFIPALLLRLVLSYGFYDTSVQNWQDIKGNAVWFAELGIPAPVFNAYLSASMETLGVWLLLIGLGTRFIAIPLMVIMIVAIKTVHWANGFAASDNGFEIPLYYFLMLLTLLFIGAGACSIDALIDKKWRKNKL